MKKTIIIILFCSFVATGLIYLVETLEYSLTYQLTIPKADLIAKAKTMPYEKAQEYLRDQTPIIPWYRVLRIKLLHPNKYQLVSSAWHFPVFFLFGLLMLKINNIKKESQPAGSDYRATLSV